MAKHRLVSKIACSLFAVVTVATAGMLTAGAWSNITDTNFSFNFNSYYTSQFTPTRDKGDYTSTYMKVTQKGGGTPSARVYGTNQAGGGSDYLTGGVDCSGGHIYPMNLGETWMINYVKENGYTYASIKGTPTTSVSAWASGVWSPDSVR